MSEHAYLPPSAAHTWGRCAAFAEANRINAHGLQCDTEQTEEGTAAHWGLVEVLEGRIIAEGQIAPNGFVLTEEMVEGCELSAAAIRELVDADQPLILEKRLAASVLGPNCWGTPDVRQLRRSMALAVIDFKWGHRFVDHIDNEQLLIYTALAIAETAAQMGMGYDQLDQRLMLELTIVQPRAFGHAPVRTVRMPATDIRGRINQLLAAAERCTPGVRGPATAGSHCFFCPGRLECPAHLASAAASADFASIEAPIDATIATLSAMLKQVRSAAQRLEGTQKALESHLMVKAQLGENVPGFTVERSSGPRKWNKPTPEVAALGDLIGIKLRKDAVVTPLAAEKLGVAKEVIDAYTARTDGQPKLVETNERLLAQIFSKE